MWEAVKDVVLCSYCRRKSAEHEENSSLLRNEKCVSCGPYHKLASEINCNPHSGIQNNSFHGSSRPQVVPTNDALQNTVTPRTPYAQSKPVDIIMPVNTSKSYPFATNGGRNSITKLSSGDQFTASSPPKKVPSPSATSTHIVRAAESVSGNIVSANSPLWKQVESINSVFDSRPPTMN